MYSWYYYRKADWGEKNTFSLVHHHPHQSKAKLSSASELLVAKESTFWKKDCAATTQLLVCEWRLQLSWLLMLESLSTVMFVGQAHLSSFQYYKSVYEEKKEEARSS